MTLINSMPPAEDFHVGVYRTISEVFSGQSNQNGIIFRDKGQILVSVNGAMMLIEFEDKDAFKFLGIPKYEMPVDNTDPSSIIISTSKTVKNHASKVTQADIAGRVNRNQNNIEQQDNNTEQERTVQEAPQAQAPPVQNVAPQEEVQTQSESIDRYSKYKYKEAIESSNIDMDKIIEDISKSNVPKENIEMLKSIKHLVKDAYIDGNDYIFIATYDINGNVTVGLIDKGRVRFTKDDWNNQSQELKDRR